MTQGPSRYSMRNVSIEGSCVGLRWLGLATVDLGRKCDSPEAIFHDVEDVATARNEKQLHDEVVERNPAEEQVKIARHENTGVEGLGLERYTWRILSAIVATKWALADLDMTASFVFYAAK